MNRRLKFGAVSVPAIVLLGILGSACGGGGGGGGVMDAPPEITIAKTANPTAVPETGGDVLFTIVLTNSGAASVTIDSLADDKFNLALRCPGAVGSTIAPAASFTCSFTENLSGSSSGPPHVNTVTAQVSGAGGMTATMADSATVTFLTVMPDVGVTKTANPTSVLETGENVEFTIVVTNNSVNSVTIDSLVDDVFDLALRCPTAVGTILASTGSFTCTFTEVVAGVAGVPHVNTATAQVSIGGSTDTDSDSATVNFITVLEPSFSPGGSAIPMSITMQPGAVSDTNFEIEIVVTDVADFFGAAFHVTFDPATATYVDFDESGSILFGGGANTLFFVDTLGPGEIAVEASLQGDVAGLPNGSGLLLTLEFEATGETPGNAFGFLPVGSRVVKSCPAAGQSCTEIQDSLTWSGGTLVVD